MSDQEEVIVDETVPVPDELALLKERATTLGITFHPNIGIEKLKEKINEKLNPETDDSADEAPTTNVEAKSAKNRLTEMRAEALKLVRIVVSNMNPVNANLKGTLVSVGNRHLGMIKKFVPFNAEQGYHVPQIILNELRAKKYMSHYEVKVGNKKHTRHRLVPEYSITILPPLTEKELNELKQRQLMAAGQSE